MRFSLFFTFVTIWIAWRFVLPLKIRTWKKVLAILLMLCVSWISGFTQLNYGSLLSPEYPRSLQIIARLAEGSLLLLGVAILIRDACIFFTVLAGRSGEKAHKFLREDRRLAIGMGLASFGLAAFGIKEGIMVPEVKARTIFDPNLPSELDGFTFVQLSDTHASKLLSEPHCEALVEKVNSLKADAIFITGDLVDGTNALFRMKDVRPLGKLTASKGVFACEGNHEHYGPYEAWIREIGKLGELKWLRNAHRTIEVTKNGKTAHLVVAGICDPMAKRFNRTLPNPREAFKGSPKDAYRILLAHQPKYFDDYREFEPFNLQLSGHTHGGQLYAMDYGVGILNRGYVKGFYKRADGTILYVHPGSGLWNGFPMRLGVPSEITLFTLRKGQNDIPIFVRHNKVIASN